VCVVVALIALGVFVETRPALAPVGQVQAVFGHGDTAGHPTLVLAANVNRQVVLLEFPGTDPTTPRQVLGPYLFGAGENRTPVTLRAEDANQDGALDLLVAIKGEQLIYLNVGAEFRLANEAERRQVEEIRAVAQE